MKLPANLLGEKLEEIFEIKESTLSAYPLLLSRPLIYSAGMKVQPKNLYISDVPSKDLCRSDICVIYTGECLPTHKNSCHICLCANSNEVFNAVQQIFNNFDEWKEQLDRVLLFKGNIRDLLSAAQTELTNPLILMDANLSPVSFSETEETMDSWASGTVFSPQKAVFDPKQNTFFNRMQTKKDAYFCPAAILGKRTLNLNIQHESRTAYHLMLVEHRRSLRSSDEWLLKSLSVYVEYMLKLERPEYHPDSRLHALILRLLTDKSADSFKLSLQLSRLDWSSEDEYFCLVLKTSAAERIGETSGQICRQLKKQYPASCSCIYDGDIVTYFNVSKLGKTLNQIDSELKYFVREHILKAGYSRSMQGHANLRRQYIQASAALRIGESLQPHRWIHRFNQISMNFLLEESTYRLPSDMLCHEKLLALRKYDQEEGTEYINTLRTYLDHSLNAVQSAKALFIHRSTFLYRLAKIKELLDSPLNAPDELLYLSISLRLIEASERIS